MGVFYCDYESFLFYPGLLTPPPVCLAFAFDNDTPEILHANFDRVKLEKLLWDALRDPNITWCAYNAAMEWITTLAWRPGWAPFLFNLADKGRIYDPYLAEVLKRIGTGDQRETLNLAQTLDDYMVPHTVDKGSYWRLRYGELWNTPVCDWPQEAKDYSLGDIAVRDLHKVQRKRTEDKYLVDLPAQVRASISLTLTSAWGFPVDGLQADKLYAETQATLESYKMRLLAEGLVYWKIEKGEIKWSRRKAVAEQMVIDAYAKMGREAPRGMLTPNMLNKAYEAAGMLLQTPFTDQDKIKQKDIDEAIECGVDEELLLGNISQDEEACINSRDPMLLAYSRYGQANMLLSKTLRFVQAARARAPIQTHYGVIMNTGRTSSTQGYIPKTNKDPWSTYGAQVQNLPRAGEEYEEGGKKKTKWGARECFVAPGYEDYLLRNPEWQKLKMLFAADLTLLPEEVIVSVDFDAFEMRTWAQCCLWILHYSDLANILNNPKRCPHIEMGTMLRGQHVESDDWAVKYAWGYGLKKSDPKELKQVRGLAKGPNFGLPGGMGAERLMDYCRLNYGVVLELDRVSDKGLPSAKTACAVWREIYREAQPYLDHISNDVLSSRKRGAKGDLVQFISNRIRGKVGFCDGANGYFQGLAADAAKASGWALMKEAYCNTSSPFFGARPLAFVHDEWLFAVRRDRLHEAAYRMRDVQLAAAQRYCPDVTLTASPAAMYRWSKVAGDPFHKKDGKLCSYEEGGELIPYEEVDWYK